MNKKIGPIKNEIIIKDIPKKIDNKYRHISYNNLNKNINKNSTERSFSLNNDNKQTNNSYLQAYKSKNNRIAKNVLNISHNIKKILKINEDVVLNMIKRNKKIVNTIRQIKNNLEEANIDFETKFKYANWKYGIADMNKYFIDIDAYKKSEEDLINKRKSFFDRLDDIIEDIKKRKKNKNLENIAKQFGIKLKDKMNNKNQELEEETDKIIFKSRDVKTSLRELFKRRKEEKKNKKKK